MTKNELMCLEKLNNVLKRHSMKIVHNTVENLPIEYEMFMVERKDDGSEQDKKLLCNWFSFNDMMGFCSIDDGDDPVKGSIFDMLRDAYMLVSLVKAFSGGGVTPINRAIKDSVMDKPENTVMSEAFVELKDLTRCKCIEEMLITMDLLGL